MSMPPGNEANTTLEPRTTIDKVVGTLGSTGGDPVLIARSRSDDAMRSDGRARSRSQSSLHAIAASRYSHARWGRLRVKDAPALNVASKDVAGERGPARIGGMPRAAADWIGSRRQPPSPGWGRLSPQPRNRGVKRQLSGANRRRIDPQHQGVGVPFVARKSTRTLSSVISGRLGQAEGEFRALGRERRSTLPRRRGTTGFCNLCNGKDHTHVLG